MREVTFAPWSSSKDLASTAKEPEDMAHLVEHLPSLQEGLGSMPRTTGTPVVQHSGGGRKWVQSLRPSLTT